MALYEYSCSKCGAVSEHLVFSDDDTPVCPSCGGDTLERLLSSFAVGAAAPKQAAASPCTSCCNSGSCGMG